MIITLNKIKAQYRLITGSINRVKHIINHILHRSQCYLSNRKAICSRRIRNTMAAILCGRVTNDVIQFPIVQLSLFAAACMPICLYR